MEVLAPIGLNLPFFAVTTLILAYLIWSKFLKEGKLKPKNVNDVLDIFSLAVFLIVVLYFSLVFLGTYLQWINLSLNLPVIMSLTPDLVGYLSLLLIFFFTSGYRHKRPKRKDLKNLLMMLLGYLILAGAFFVGLILAVMITDLGYVLPTIPLILLGIFIALVMRLSANNIFEINFRKELLQNSFLFVLVLVLIATTAVGYFLFTPKIEYSGPTYEHYYLMSVNGDRYEDQYRESYLTVSVPIEVRSYGIVGSLAPYLPISYKDTGLDAKNKLRMSDTGEYKFMVDVFLASKNKTSMIIDGLEGVKAFKNKSDEKYGYTEAILSEEHQLLFLGFDRSVASNEDTGRIILKGLVRKNLSRSDYNYTDNAKSETVCNRSSCAFVFNITNNLTLPVSQDGFMLISLGGRFDNTSRCHFVNVTPQFTDDVRYRVVFPDCQGDYCELELANESSVDEIFSMQLVREGDFIMLRRLDVKEPMQVSARFELDCD
jgi:hypothetical protein